MLARKYEIFQPDLDALQHKNTESRSLQQPQPHVMMRFLGDSSHLFELKVLPATHGLRQTSRQNCFHRGFPHRHDVQLALKKQEVVK